jgi:hypothetical protein
MPTTPGDFKKRIIGILQSVQLLPDEAKAPILHYQRTIGEISGSLDYVGRLIAERQRYQGVVDKHFGRLRGMALVNLIETFERFLKEVAAECVDCLADLVIDDRFNTFPVQGATLASHFGSGSAGKALCESTIWLDCREINDRFRKLLADPFKTGDFYVFPKESNQQPVAEQWRYEVMSLIWQFRHTCVHNVGVITKSDAVKLRVLSKSNVDAPRVLVPSKTNILWLKLFLNEVAEDCNQRIGERLGVLLTTISNTTPALVQPQSMADRLASIFRLPLQVGGATGVVPPD